MTTLSPSLLSEFITFPATNLKSICIANQKTGSTRLKEFTATDVEEFFEELAKTRAEPIITHLRWRG